MSDPAPLIDAVVLAGEPFMGVVPAGHRLRIVDLEGNQAVDTLFYNATDTGEHYSAQDTIQAQGNIYLTTGTVLRSNRGRALLTIEADTCGRHDTLGGACSAESNTVRYALDKRHMHNCRDSFLLALARKDRGMSKRDLPIKHQLLHERAGDARWRPQLRGRHFRRRSPCRTAHGHGRAGADLQLPAAQQPLQRLQSHAHTRARLGTGLKSAAGRRDDPPRCPLPAGTTWRFTRSAVPCSTRS